MNKTQEEINKRSKNFSEEECVLILNLIKEKKEIMECKKVSRLCYKEKEEEWKKIGEKFNRLSGVKLYRDWRSIKGKYENMKKSYKKKFNERATSGSESGQNRLNSLSVLDWKIKGLLDSIIDVNQSEFNFDDKIGCDEPEEIQVKLDPDDPSLNFSDNEYSEPISELIEPKSQPVSLNGKSLQNLSTRPTNENCDLLELQRNIYEEQLMMAREEHNLKVKFLKEEHEAKLKILELEKINKQLEIDIKTKMLKQ